MFKVKDIESGQVYDVFEIPTRNGDYLESSGIRFYDPNRDRYEISEVQNGIESVGPIHFQMLFTSEEAVAAAAARADDPALNRFWKLIEDPRTDVVNLGLQSVQQAVEYTLTVAKGAGVELDVPTRKAEILSGVLQ